ncbi:hypothetical protein KDX23_25255 [Burkholderia vietnamiensis]|uniref:hypothetical protein n=1 Tax=Burkholderia vietnamiensis TaxID=60552 RepID=UPI001B991D9B|nr:hypothetical protein [Burkholderia vietnamiensis]MBR8086045.1 hypothetical protein [Burkholderia vietnamiensis]
MTKQSHEYNNIDTIRHEICERIDRAPLRIALRLWGYDASQAQTWIESLPTLDGSIAWALAVAPDNHDADVVVHMVKPSRPVGSTFCWNCIGANRAIARRPSASGTALVLFAGHASQMPSARTGQWIVADGLSPCAALSQLSHLITAAAAPTSSGAMAVRNHLLEMMVRELDGA